MSFDVTKKENETNENKNQQDENENENIEKSPLIKKPRPKDCCYRSRQICNPWPRGTNWNNLAFVLKLFTQPTGLEEWLIKQKFYAPIDFFKHPADCVLALTSGANFFKGTYDLIATLLCKCGKKDDNAKKCKKLLNSIFKESFNLLIFSSSIYATFASEEYSRKIILNAALLLNTGEKIEEHVIDRIYGANNNCTFMARVGATLSIENIANALMIFANFLIADENWQTYLPILVVGILLMKGGIDYFADQNAEQKTLAIDYNISDENNKRNTIN